MCDEKFKSPNPLGGSRFAGMRAKQGVTLKFRGMIKGSQMQTIITTGVCVSLLLGEPEARADFWGMPEFRRARVFAQPRKNLW